MLNGRRLLVPLVVAAVILLGSTPGRAQGSFFTSLSGTIADSSGALVPGASVVATNNGTGEDFNAVSGVDGGFTIPSLPGGVYSVTVSLMGFKTAVLKSVTLNAAVPASVKITLEVGALEESVTVVGEAAAIIQTRTPSIATNLTGEQITSLPLTSRNALDSLTSLPGFNTSGTARDSTINGLPKSAVNITLDGMNIQDNYLKTSDGYFARLQPTLDSVEEMTVTTAGNTVDATGQGGVQIRFVTKAGTNNWRGTAYEYYRSDKLNANTWFNNRDLPPDPATGKAPMAKLRQYQQGAAQGGPIVKDKAFFFFNYEELRQPGSSTLTRVRLTQDAMNGVFTYNAAGATRSVNLLQLAAANGQLASLDPTVAKVMADIATATKQSGSLTPLSNPLVQQYVFQIDTSSFNPSPTFRIDYVVSDKHRLNGSMNYRHINSTPDTTNNAQVPFPGFPQTGSQQSTRWTTSEGLRSVFTNNLVNELRVGGTGGATFFSPELEPSMWTGNDFGKTGGYKLNFFTACCGTGFQLTNPNTGNTRTSGGANILNTSAREASTKVIEDTATWIKGRHSVSFGASFTQADVWLKTQSLVPSINFGLLTSDPAAAMFSAANFPGASTTDLTNAQNLYAILTGRTTNVTADARINSSGDNYVTLGPSLAQGRMREFDLYAGDTWRVAQTVTISAGARYVLALPFYPVNNSYTTVTEASLYGISGVGNLFQPGVMTGTKPNFIQYPAGTYAYSTDKNNFGPSVGVAWQVPGQDNAIGRILFGAVSGDSVLRGGGMLAFQRPGMSDFTGVFGANQGIAVSLVNSNPGLLRDPASLALPGSPAATYPIAPTSITNTVNTFDSNLQVPYTQSYSVGWQRKLGQNSALEVRWVGTKHRQDWDTVNINEINITSNGFLNEFRKAQANLQANIAAGKGNTFAYTGAPGTVPLPIFLAYLNGVTATQSGDASKYTGTNWSNATYLGFLAAMNPNPFGFMCANAGGCTTSTLTNGFVGNAGLRNNAATAGLPANFFLANPDVIGGAYLTTNSGGTSYNSIQFEFRKRMSKGLAFLTSYTWGRAWQEQRYGFTKPLQDIMQTGTVGGVQHAFKANWLYDLPFGRDQRFGRDAGPWLNGLIGGWSFDGVARIQTGEMLDFGDVRVVGMSIDELKKSIGLRVGANGQLYILPQDIIDNTVKAFQVSATSPTGYGALGAPTGRYLAPANGPDCIETAPSYGDCGVRSLVVNGPPLIRFDLSVVKHVPIHGSVTFEFRAEMLNAFNRPYFNAGPGTGMSTNYAGPGGAIFQNGTPFSNAIGGSSADSYRLTALLGDNQSRIIQFVWRVRW